MIRCNNLKNILRGIIVFVFISFSMVLNVNAIDVYGEWKTDTNVFSLSIFGDGAIIRDKVYLDCEHDVTGEKFKTYVSNYSSQGSSEKLYAAIPVKGLRNGLWECEVNVYYTDGDSDTGMDIDYNKGTYGLCSHKPVSKCIGKDDFDRECVPINGVCSDISALNSAQCKGLGKKWLGTRCSTNWIDCDSGYCWSENSKECISGERTKGNERCKSEVAEPEEEPKENQANMCGGGTYTYEKSPKEDCNAKYEAGFCHLWNEKESCCKRTPGECRYTPTPAPTNPPTNTPTPSNKSEKEICIGNGNIYNEDSNIASVGCYKNDEDNCTTFGYCWENNACNLNKKCEKGKNYKISFNENKGFGLDCDTGFTVPSAGICLNEVIAGTNVKFPSSTKNLLKGNKSALGWSKILANGVPVCTKDTIVTDDSYKVESNSEFYACYEEDVGGYRYVKNGYVADGGSVDYTCGQSMWIEYCTQEDGVGYCYYYDGSSYRKIYRDKVVNSYAAANCSNENSSATKVINAFRYVGKSGSNYSCGDQLYITDCTEDECNYSQVKTSSKTITVDLTVVDRAFLAESKDGAEKLCKLEEEFDSVKKCSGDYKNSKKKNMIGKKTYSNFCYKEDYSNEDIYEAMSDIYSCANGYKITSVYNNDGEERCNDHGICINDFTVICSKGDSAKPSLAVSSATVQSNGYGLLVVQASAVEGKIDSYFVSDYYQTPTNSNRGWTNVESNKFTIESSPGVKFIWVRDSYGNISNAIRGVVLDSVNSDTTVKNLQLYDANGSLQTPSRVSYSSNSIKSSKYVMMSNSLSKDSSVLADGFNPYDMEYNLKVSSPTVTVYATLTSTDSSYVEGYEPRTVNLDYGVNTVLIKIRNKEGKIRTYTILVTRTDDRTSDNTLKEISLSVGKINFNANVTDYKIEVPKGTTEVDVKSIIASDKASYVSGYEPGKVETILNTTVKLIKVKSETGSTRTYVLTFVKEGTDIISKESLQLSDLVIPGAYIPFERDVVNYSTSVSYETDVIDILSTLKDENSTVFISVKRKSDSDYSIVSNNGISLDVGENFIVISVINSENEKAYYRLTIIRKEEGLKISNDTALKDLKVLGYDIDFNPNKKEYTVRIKQEKSLVVTAVPNSNRAEVFIRGNEELTGFSTVRVKVVAENGEFETYSIDIKKDAFNKTIEIAAIVAGVVIILVSSGIIIVKKKSKAKKEYFEE